jgi:putative ABC transport system permease protein
MLRLTLKNLAANRIRLAMTTFAVILAVAFVVSSFVLTDGLRSSFGDLSQDIVAGTDLELRPVEEFGEAGLLPEPVLDDVAAIDGVAAAAPVYVAENSIRPINSEGQEISSSGPPQISFGWVDDARLNTFTVVEGEPPASAGEFSMDLDAAASHGFAVGETYNIVTPTGRTEATLTGLTRFGENNDTLGATLMQFNLADLQAMVGEEGYDSIAVALTSDADKAAVEAAMLAISPATEVVDQATLESEQRASFNEGIDIIGNILLGFAGISLFVSTFIIYNTFSIVLGQRTRELALLRTVGADPVQLRRSVRIEALMIGIVASAVGIIAGIGVALGLRELFGLLGAELPESPIVISLRTVLVAAAVGIGVTLISAVGPARKAAKVSPIAALRDGVDAGAVSGRLRMLLGSLLTIVGLGAGAVGLFVASGTANIILMLAVGSISVFVGVTMLSPVVATPLTSLMGWPLRSTMGMSGQLAQQNAGRNPQRTATTAAALMIGLALVAMTFTVGESVKAQLRSTLESSVKADYLAIDDSGGGSPFPTEVKDRFVASSATDVVTSFRYDDVMVDGEIRDALGTDFAATDVLFDLGIDQGVGVDPTVEHPLMVSDEEALASGIEVGDVVAMTFASGEARDMTVIAIYTDDIVAEEPFMVDLHTWNEVGAAPTDMWLAIALAEGVTGDQADAAFAPIGTDFPQVEISTANAYVERAAASIDQALATVNVMVALAVIIALIGIANTLALSVFERTRELGLLRAVGMTRRQLRRMVRLEAALVALFGAILGVGLGVLFGWAAVVALPASVTSTLSVPVTRILVLVGVAGAAGLVAAFGPARRASKLNVLDAISG